MAKFRVSFMYMDDHIDDIMEGNSEDDIQHELEWYYESEAFYDNHYMSDLEIEEIIDES